MKRKRYQSYMWMLVNTVFWGASFFFVKPALSVTTPTRYLLYRYIFASVLSLPILYHYKNWFKQKAKRNKFKKIVLPLALIELLGTTLVLWLLYTGLQYTTSIEANLLTLSLPLFVTLGGVMFLKEKEEKHEALGLILSLIGTVILVLTPLTHNGGTLQLTSLAGNFVILIAVFLTAVYYLLAKKYYDGYPKFLISTLSFYVGLVSFFILAIFESGINHQPSAINHFMSSIIHDFQSTPILFAASYMALFGSIIGLTAYYKGQEHIEASEASLFTYLQPLVAIPLGVMLLHESIYPAQIVGLLIIVAGVYWAERRTK